MVCGTVRPPAHLLDNCWSNYILPPHLTLTQFGFFPSFFHLIFFFLLPFYSFLIVSLYFFLHFHPFSSMIYYFFCLCPYFCVFFYAFFNPSCFFLFLLHFVLCLFCVWGIFHSSSFLLFKTIFRLT